MDENKKISSNRQKKIGIVAGLNTKIAKSKAIIFTNYTGVTHKQLEALKKAIKPMDAEYVVAKNSLVLRALEENKIKLEGDNPLEGPTGTLLIYADIVAPLKQLAKTMKELGLLSVKLGVMENKLITGEQVLKISTLPSRETLLTQIAVGLKSPISGLHRALSWNLQKLVMTLGAIGKNKPAVAEPKTAPVVEPKLEATIAASAPVVEPIAEVKASEPEPETILAETPAEKTAEQPDPIAEPASTEAPVIEPETEESKLSETKSFSKEKESEGGEN